MHAALRPYATAGIALVGASVIAVTPIAPPPPDIRTASPAVQLTGVYTQLVQDTLQNAGVLVRVYFAEPFPIIQAIVGLNVTAPTDIPTALRDVGNAVVEAVLGGLVSTGLALYAFVQAVATFNPIEVFRVVFVAPGLIAGAVLNGLPFPFPSVGILNPGQLGEPFGLSGWPLPTGRVWLALLSN